MRDRPTVVLVHGGPGGYDHSYFKPDFGRLTTVAQVVYLDLRDHGRSARHDPNAWTFEACADDVRAFCDAVGIARPIVLGHSMGGFIAMLYGARHPGHAGGLVLQSTWARFDLARIVDGFRAIAGDEVAALAGRDYGGDPVSDEDWDRVFAAFGPHIPDADQLARRLANPAVNAPGMARMQAFDAIDELAADRLPHARRRRRPRPDHPACCGPGDRGRARAGDRPPGGHRRRRPLPVARRAGPLLAGDRGVRDRRRLTVAPKSEPNEPLDSLTR